MLIILWNIPIEARIPCSVGRPWRHINRNLFGIVACLSSLAATHLLINYDRSNENNNWKEIQEQLSQQKNWAREGILPWSERDLTNNLCQTSGFNTACTRVSGLRGLQSVGQTNGRDWQWERVSYRTGQSVNTIMFKDGTNQPLSFQVNGTGDLHNDKTGEPDLATMRSVNMCLLRCGGKASLVLLVPGRTMNRQ